MKKTKKSSILMWIVSVLLIMSGGSLLVESFGFAVLMILLGISLIPVFKQKLNDKFGRKLVILIKVILAGVLFIGLFVADYESQKLENLVPYTIVQENDFSYAGCLRMDYRVVLDKNANQLQVKDVLMDVYNKKRSNSIKTVVYAYPYEVEDKIGTFEAQYMGRLFMPLDCDQPNGYEIDFDQWEF